MLFTRHSSVAGKLLAGLALPLILLCGCDSGGDDPEASAPPQIKGFSVQPALVPPGGEITLSWNVSGVDHVTIEPQGGTLPPSGELKLTPSQDTTYTLEASNPLGNDMRILSVRTAAYDWSALDQRLDLMLPLSVRGYVFKLNVDGVEVYSRTGGSYQENGIIPIASASKALVAVAMLTLVRDGKLDLDRPVSQYIGGIVDWPSDKSAITTRMLLNHTSGLQDDAPCLTDSIDQTLRSCVQSIADMPLMAAPATVFRYGGNGYQVAGLVAEVLSGMSFRSFFSSHLTSPLGLDSVRFFGTNPPIAGGAVANAGDYLRFAQMILDGGQIDGQSFLPASLVAQLRASQIDGLPRILLPPGARALAGYSLGWWFTAPEDLAGKSMGPEISDPGAFGTVPWMDFDKRYAAVLLINDRVQTGVRVWEDLRPMILDQLNHPG